MQNPERLMVTHPFNPVYLIPLVEVVGGTKTKGNFIKKMIDFLNSIDMKPILLEKEIEAFVAD